LASDSPTQTQLFVYYPLEVSYLCDFVSYPQIKTLTSTR